MSIDIVYWEDDTITVQDSQGLDRPLRLRGDEAATLILGLRQLAGQDLEHRDAVDSALAKLEAVVDGVPEPAAAAAGDPVVTSAVSTALAQHRRLALTYHGAGAEAATERTVDPIRSVTADGQTYLQGYCHSAGDVRTFRLDRVSAARVLNETADLTVPAPPVGYRPAPGDLTAVLLLAPDARWVPEYYPVESVEELPDGSLRVTLRSASLVWLRRLVMRLGGRAQVLAPDALVEAVPPPWPPTDSLPESLHRTRVRRSRSGPRVPTLRTSPAGPGGGCEGEVACDDHHQGGVPVVRRREPQAPAVATGRVQPP
jgi:proteasome accessory factor C